MRPIRAFGGVALAAVATLAATLTAAAPATGQATTANIRLAHFSPDTPEMDVYVVGFDGSETRVLDGLGYGEVSDYAALPAGNYSFLLRPMGAPADSTPAVTAEAELANGSAYTFAAMGPNAQLQKALLTDDLAAPPAGQAKVRLIQASSSAGDVDVTVIDGPALAQDRPFASATEYAPVAAGAWTVQLTTADGTTVQRRLPLDAGTVNTLVVLEGTGAGPEITRVVDATGTDASGTLGAAPAVPLGGVGTGGGGTADAVLGDDPASRSTGVAALGALLLVGLIISTGVVGTRALRQRSE